MTGNLENQAAGRLVFPGLVAIAVLAGYAAGTNAKPIGVWIFALVLVGWIISLCLHEFAHAAVALAGGDTSVRARGYLTLNPLRYVHASTSIIIPVIILAVGGIPLPGGAVLIENHRLETRAWSSLVSFAGPATNLLVGVVLTFTAKSLPQEYTNGEFVPSGLFQALSFLALLQFVTAILNILPIPGFDGFGIIAPYLSAATQRAVAPMRGWAPLAVFVILLSFPSATSYLFRPALDLLQQIGGDYTRYGAALGQHAFRFWQR